MRVLLVPLCLVGCRAVPDDETGKAPSDSADPSWFVDADRDGFGDPAAPADEGSAGAVADGSDCDDANAAVHPGADESCDGVDENCDGAIDEGVTLTIHPDADADGFGSAAQSDQACVVAAGWTVDASDCDDADTTVNPDAEELCNGRDDDCDGATDDDDDAVTGATQWYEDTDGDGYGAAGTEPLSACVRPEGWVVATGDCDDTNAAIRPEWGLDDMDCDGQPGLSVTTSRTTVRGRFDKDHLGQYLAVGDADGDGLTDVYARGEGGSLYYGAVWVIGGEQLARGGTSDTSEALAELRGESENSGFGLVPLLIEDRDGDGLAELLSGSYDGTAYFPSTTLGSASSFSDATAIVTYNSLLGASVFGLVPDLDDDGSEELVFGSGNDDAGGLDGGRVYFMPATVLETGGDIADSPTTITGQERSATGSQSRVIDLDGDGIVEVLVSAVSDTTVDTTRGAIYTFRTSTLTGGGAFQTSDADAVLGTHRPDGNLGNQIQALDDVDGDGAVDVLVYGADEADSGEFWLVGGPDLLVGGLAEELAITTWVGQEENEVDNYGVANAGDVDGDGKADLVIGSPYGGPPFEYWGAGRAYLYLGSRIAGGGTLLALDNADAVFTGDTPDQSVGFSVAGAGDVDGDGRDDILIGAPGEANGEVTDAGALHVLTSTF